MGLFTSLISIAFATTALAAPASRFTYFNLKTPAAGPCDLYTGPDGNIYSSTFLADKLVKITRTSANPQLTEITIPYTRAASLLSILPSRLQGAGSCVIQPGYDGNVYIATGIRNQIAQYNPRNGNFKFFDAAGGILGNLQPFNDGWPSKQGVREPFFRTTFHNAKLWRIDVVHSDNSQHAHSIELQRNDERLPSPDSSFKPGWRHCRAQWRRVDL